MSPVHLQINQLDHFAVEAVRILSNIMNKLETVPSQPARCHQSTHDYFERLEKMFNSRLVKFPISSIQITS